MPLSTTELVSIAGAADSSRTTLQQDTNFEPQRHGGTEKSPQYGMLDSNRPRPQRRVLDPTLGHNQIDPESDPECGTKEVVWCQACEATGCKEEPHNRPHGGDSQCNRHRTNHPFPVRRRVAMPDMPKPAQ